MCMQSHTLVDSCAPFTWSNVAARWCCHKLGTSDFYSFSSVCQIGMPLQQHGSFLWSVQESSLARWPSCTLHQKPPWLGLCRADGGAQTLTMYSTAAISMQYVDHDERGRCRACQNLQIISKDSISMADITLANCQSTTGFVYTL